MWSGNKQFLWKLWPQVPCTNNKNQDGLYTTDSTPREFNKASPAKCDVMARRSVQRKCLFLGAWFHSFCFIAKLHHHLLAWQAFFFVSVCMRILFTTLAYEYGTFLFCQNQAQAINKGKLHSSCNYITKREGRSIWQDFQYILLFLIFFISRSTLSCCLTLFHLGWYMM